jgi:serine/threonine protein kinase
MIDGGIDLGKVWINESTKQFKNRFESFKKINTSLIDLLNNGIVPLNKEGLYHFDIKDTNILLKEDGNTRTTRTRLIDWGTAFIYNKSSTAVPSMVLYRSMFSFNVPFSSIFFFPG